MRSPIPSEQDLGRPALRVAGLSLWVHGREFPEAIEIDDGNWLQVTACCNATGACIWVQGPILMVTDIAGFGEQCQTMLDGKGRSAALDPLEPELSVLLELTDSLGHIRATVEITSDNVSQSHSMAFEIDQSHLPEIIKQCRAISLRG